MAIDRRTARRLIGLSLLALIASAIVVSVRGEAAWEWLVENEQRVRNVLVNERPIIGFFAGLIVFTLISLVPGLVGKSLAVGWLFGFWRSLAIVNISLTIVALIEFLLTRYLLRDSIQSRFGFYLLRVNEALARDGAFYLFSARVAHVPYTATNYLMGATSMRTVPFWWSTQVGLLPSNILFCYAGDQLPTLKEVSTHGFSQMMSLELWIAFFLLAIFPWIGKAIVRRVQKSSMPPPIKT